VVTQSADSHCSRQGRIPLTRATSRSSIYTSRGSLPSGTTSGISIMAFAWKCWVRGCSGSACPVLPAPLRSKIFSWLCSLGPGLPGLATFSSRTRFASCWLPPKAKHPLTCREIGLIWSLRYCNPLPMEPAGPEITCSRQSKFCSNGGAWAAECGDDLAGGNGFLGRR
jgi:hypothetical protein